MKDPKPCSAWEEKLSTPHFEDLSRDDQTALIKHIKSCDNCASVLNQYRKTDAIIRNLPPVKPLPGFPPQLLQLWEMEDNFNTSHNFIAEAHTTHITIPTSSQSKHQTATKPTQIKKKPTKTRDRALPRRVEMIVLVAIIIIASLFLFHTHPHTQPKPAPPLHTASARQGTPHLQINNITPTPTQHTYLSPPSLENFTNTITRNGRLSLNDPLINNEGGNQWDEYSSNFICAFKGNAYHSIVSQSGYITLCYSENSNLSNFVFQVHMIIIKGDGGGIVFRSNKTNLKMYRFRIGQDGTFDLYTSQGDNTGKTLALSYSPAINRGPNQLNVITVVANGSNIDLYANQQLLVSVSDNTISAGKIGLFSVDFTHSTDVLFKNAKAWIL